MSGTRTAAWIARMEGPAFAESLRMEQVIFSVRGPERADAMRAAGVKVSDHSYGGPTPFVSLMLR